MNPKTILAVEREIVRLKDALYELYAEAGAGEQDISKSIPESTLIVTGREMLSEASHLPWSCRGRHAATLKRRSMDLTRALADLRQGR